MNQEGMLLELYSQYNKWGFSGYWNYSWKDRVILREQSLLLYSKYHNHLKNKLRESLSSISDLCNSFIKA
jgi:hypothetical protein